MAEAHELEPEDTGFKAPEPKSLAEIRDADKDDSSLEQYKKQLLGEGIPDPVFPNNPENVIVQKIEIEFPNDSHPPVEIMLLDQNLEKLKSTPVIIKEGVNYFVKIYFFVQRDIVYGLRYLQGTHRKGLRVSKDEMPVGCYSPKSEPHVFRSAMQEAPSGMIARGTYTIKSKFADDDKNSILSWEWAIRISSSWKD